MGLKIMFLRMLLVPSINISPCNQVCYSFNPSHTPYKIKGYVVNYCSQRYGINKVRISCFNFNTRLFSKSLLRLCIASDNTQVGLGDINTFQWSDKHCLHNFTNKAAKEYILLKSRQVWWAFECVTMEKQQFTTNL